ncbi:translation initiation factor IF-3 [Ischnura elegans]|uniref:translation initiation factor IF-3 n=1 Tax=Ischnura elegans TaxID=197161 RepID=UPI001ED87BBF|nr:translation initiation factor IF-3 [Ischnura elegans]
MIWRQLLRIVHREVVFCQRIPIFRQCGWLFGNAKFKTITCARQSSVWTGGISKGGPTKTEDTAKGSNAKKDTSPKITLVSPDDKVSVVSLEEGHNIAKRRNLRLVKMVEYDTKTQRPVYRMMSVSEYNLEHKKDKASKAKTHKREKHITFSSRISDHDMQSKVKMIDKWLAKDHEVRVIIAGDSNDMSGAEEVYKALEGEMKERSRFLQKRQVNADIRFSIRTLPGNKHDAIQGTKGQLSPPEDS